MHYGRVLVQSGPIINLSTFRFESKHRDKKRQASATCSPKNITHTLFLKEQLALCYRLMTKKGFVTNDSDGPFECLDHVSYSHNYSLFKDTLPEFFNGPCLILNWVKVNGQIYRSRICVVMRLEELMGEMLPVFEMIDQIIKNVDGQFCLVVNVMSTNGFNFDLHVYEIFETRRVECIFVNDLHSPFPVIICKWVNGNTFATIRHSL